MFTQNDTRPSFVRIAIDDRLYQAIEAIRKQYPLLSTAEAVKMILSKGLVTSERSLTEILTQLKTTNPIQHNLSEEESFEEWERFNKTF
jgi:hypothetical protein